MRKHLTQTELEVLAAGCIVLMARLDMDELVSDEADEALVEAWLEGHEAEVLENDIDFTIRRTPREII